MIPTLVSKPFHRDGWIYEEKVDGYRMVAYKERDRVRLISRNGIDHARRYPDVAAAIARLPVSSLVLDGELAVFDAQLRSRFDWLRHPQPAEVATPPVLIVFDLMYVKGRDVSRRPLRDRRARLEDLVAEADRIHAVRRLAPHGLEAWAQVLERGYEGWSRRMRRASTSAAGLARGSRSSSRTGPKGSTAGADDSATRTS